MITIVEPRSARRIVLGLSVVWILFELVAMTGICPAPHVAFRSTPSPFLASAMVAAFVMFLAARSADGRSLPGALLSVVVGSAIVFGAVRVLTERHDLISSALWAVSSVGIASIGAAALDVVRALWRARHDPATALGDHETHRSLGAFIVIAALPIFVAMTSSGLVLSAALHPTILDGACMHLDASLSNAPSFSLAFFARAIPGVTSLLTGVYVLVPVAVGVVHVAERRAEVRPAIDVLTLFCVASLVGYGIYHLCPVSGPKYMFGERFPSDPPFAIDVPFEGRLMTLAPRNGVPSLHTTWALLMASRSAPLGRAWRNAGLLFLVLTLAATIVLGEHYVVDLVFAVPFVVAIDAALTPEVSPKLSVRWLPIAVSVALATSWLVLIRGEFASLDQSSLVAGWMFASVLVPLALWRRLRVAKLQGGTTALTRVDVAPRADFSLTLPLAAVFFVSGFAGLVYEVVFGKALALTFGSSAQASLTVLATYMGGMALGSWIGGRLAAGRSDPLKLYAYAELGMALWCVLSPVSLFAVRAAYVAIAAGSAPGAFQVALQLSLGSLVLLPATLAMGITMPLLARRFLDGEQALGSAVGLLYGMNTLGAAVGAITTGYFITPLLGVSATTRVAVVLNLLVAWIALRLAARQVAAPSRPSDADDGPRISPARTPLDSSHADVTRAATERRLATAILMGGGVVTLALEVIYTHLLAAVAGNSTYAFSLMLFAFLVGLALGAAVAKRFLGRTTTLVTVGALEIGVALAILVGVFVWESIPAYFASFSAFPGAQTFGKREFVRFLVCSVAMLPPAVFIGALYPAALDRAARGHDRPAFALGRAAALNTLGNIVGGLTAGFVLLPLLGSLRSLQVLALFALGLGLLPMWIARRSRILPALAVVTLVLFATTPRQFDLTALASGANVYFQGQPYGDVVDSLESVAGGFTTIAQSERPGGKVVKTMLTNGKFQGDDSREREMRAQYAFGLLPLLHTSRRDRALVIGFGVGGTVQALRDAGIAHIDVAELSGDVLRMADKHFAGVNGDVLHDPHVHPLVVDGRNHLLLHQGDYELISIEVTSIWFAGAASLYNREFYQLTKRRLAPGGVLQQWIQLHHITGDDLASILATVRSEFPEVWLYTTGSQGQIVACLERCPPSDESMDMLDAAPTLAPVLSLFGGRARTLLDHQRLDTAGVDRAIRGGDSGLRTDLISTDDNLLLEYATPRGNVLPYDLSLEGNLTFLARIREESRAPSTPHHAP